MNALSRRLLFGTSAAVVTVTALPAATVATSPDAALIRLCVAHAGRMDAVNTTRPGSLV